MYRFLIGRDIVVTINCIVYSALTLEKSAISKAQKHIICIFKNGKKSIFAHEEGLKLPKMHFLTFFRCKN